MPNVTRLLLSSFIISSLFVDPAIGQSQSPSVPPVVFDLPAENISSSGQIRLLWKIPDQPEPPEAVSFELHRSRDPQFANHRVIYTGPDLASYISGLRNGDYYFRVRSVDANTGAYGAWSKPILVTVEHHSLSLALWLAALGGTVFLLTVGVVVFGTRRVAREEAQG